MAICLECFIVALHLMAAAGQLSTDEGSAELARREEAAVRQAVANVSESVVQIRTIGGLEHVERELIAQGPTTGLVISANGYVVSSAFNFVQQPASILITLASGQRVPASIVATDHSRMLVLLKAHGVDGLAVPEFTPPDEIRVGQWAITVGRVFQADRTNVAVGIVSALDRIGGRTIQTDAAVSMANYGGPLVDVRGRVLGVIVPMSPFGTEMAGMEWYDSGIGFAVPLAAIADRIEQMKNGEDQFSGRLGVSLVSGNSFIIPAELAAVRPDSPAGQAGLKKGDRIVGIDGNPVATQSQFRQLLGPRYAGQGVSLDVLRGKQQFGTEVVLAGELPAFRHAYLGILPLIDAPSPDSSEPNDKGVAVRMVVPLSPADEAGVKAGDVVTRINAVQVASVESAFDVMNSLAVGDLVELNVLRDGDTITMPVKTTAWEMNIPQIDLPEMFESPAGSQSEDFSGAEQGTVKLPGFAHSCDVYVPKHHAEHQTLAAFLWLRGSESPPAKELLEAWKPTCDEHGIVLAIATPDAEDGWERGDFEFCRRMLLHLKSTYPIDPRRCVVHGEADSGEMAYLVGFVSRGLVHGISVRAAPLPFWFRVPENEPATRLAVFSTAGRDDTTDAAIRLGLEKIHSAGYPVTTPSTREAGGEWTDGERANLARWIDTLDRF